MTAAMLLYIDSPGFGGPMTIDIERNPAIDFSIKPSSCLLCSSVSSLPPAALIMLLIMSVDMLIMLLEYDFGMAPSKAIMRSAGQARQPGPRGSDEILLPPRPTYRRRRTRRGYRCASRRRYRRAARRQLALSSLSAASKSFSYRSKFPAAIFIEASLEFANTAFICATPFRASEIPRLTPVGVATNDIACPFTQASSEPNTARYSSSS